MTLSESLSLYIFNIESIVISSLVVRCLVSIIFLHFGLAQLNRVSNLLMVHLPMVMLLNSEVSGDMLQSLVYPGLKLRWGIAKVRVG